MATWCLTGHGNYEDRRAVELVFRDPGSHSEGYSMTRPTASLGRVSRRSNRNLPPFGLWPFGDSLILPKCDFGLILVAMVCGVSISAPFGRRIGDRPGEPAK